LNLYLDRSKTNFTWKQYHLYRTDLASIFQYFIEYNHLYGRIFMCFLMANCPANAFFMIFLIFGTFPVLAKTYLYAYSVIQMSCLFGMHFYFVRFSKRFHQSSGVLLSL